MNQLNICSAAPTECFDNQTIIVILNAAKWLPAVIENLKLIYGVSYTMLYMTIV